MHEASDGDLLCAFREGDTHAFTELVHRHEGALLQHARALLGTGSPYEDVVQEAFLKLAQSPPELPAESAGDARLERVHLLSWLHKVTRNACMDVMRSETRRKHREHDAALHDVAEGGLRSVDENDTRAAVARELERLPEEQREVLALRLFGDRSYKEIAEITGKKIGTVGWLVSMGLQALSERLEPLLAGGDGTGQGVRVVAPRLDVVRGELS